MNAIRNLVLGSAAALLAVAGAQAADLPVKAKAVEFVRICSLYGAGFFYMISRRGRATSASAIAIWITSPPVPVWR